ncbi:MAG TPA: FAD-binding oxidoreductase [Candidatus Baltobacteraceae bacterium]|jgi:glycolate oxidase FAD binding subunit|nr:FAD-binding oxidoreductase [Candidatus Baltobacteraceae bacterium]
MDIDVHDPRAYALDTLLPEHVHTPATVHQLADLIRAHKERRDTIVFFGNGSLQGIGNLPTRYNTAISLHHLHALIAHEPADLTIAVQAGMTIADFDQRLARQRQFVPLDAPYPQYSTIGGVLASGWLSPRRAAYGRSREFLIGVSAVLNDGTVASAGGMVVKSSTGYDLGKLYVGSLGTLGAIVRANFKTLPRPQVARLFVAPLPEGSAARVVPVLADLPIEPTLCLRISGFENDIDVRPGLEGRIAVMLEGTKSTVERATRDLRSALGLAGVPDTSIFEGADLSRAFAQILTAYVAPVGNRSLTVRSLGLPTTVFQRAALLRETAKQYHFIPEEIIDMRTGDAIVRLVAADPPSLAQEAANALATMRSVIREAPPTVIAGGAGIRHSLDAWGDPPNALDKMRAIKSQFDPTGIFAPGRFVGGL